MDPKNQNPNPPNTNTNPRQPPNNPQPQFPINQSPQPQNTTLEDQPYGGRSSALPPVDPAPQTSPAAKTSAPFQSVVTPPNLPSAPPPGTNQQFTPPLNQQPAPPPPPNLSQGSPVAKFLLAVFIFLIVVSLSTFGSGIALAYNNYKLVTLPKPLQNLFDQVVLVVPLPKTQRLVLEQMELAMQKTKSATLEEIFELQTDTATSPVKDVKLTIKGPFDFESSTNPKYQFDLVGSVKTEGIELSASGSVVGVGDNLYFKINEIPGGSFAKLDQLKKQWYFINTKQYQTQQMDAQKQAELTAKAKVLILKYLDSSGDWSTLSTINNDYVIVMKPTNEVINNFIYDFIALASQANKSGQLEQSIQKDNLKKLTEPIQNLQITLNVNKNTYQLEKAQTQLDMNIKAPQTSTNSGNISLTPASDVKFRLSYTVNLSDFNKQVVIQPPTDAKDLMPILQNMMGGYIQQLQHEQKQMHLNPNLPFLPNESTPSPTQGQNGIQIIPTIPSATPSASPSGSPLQNLMMPSPVLGQKYIPWDLEILKGVNMILPK